METFTYNKFYEMIDFDDDSDLIRIVPGSMMESEIYLEDPILSMDISRKEQLPPLLVAVSTIEKGEVKEVPFYARQQLVISEISSAVAELCEIEDIRFPAVGAELLTKRKLHNISWNIGKVRAGRNNLILAFGLKELDEAFEEAVIFNVKLRGEWQSFLWERNRLLKIDLTYPVELRVRDGVRYNYTNSVTNDLIQSVPMTYTLFQRGKSYYAYIDGCPYYVPYENIFTVRVVNNRAVSNEGAFICILPESDGNYVIEDKTFRVIRKTAKRADSSQQIATNRASLVTVSYLLDELKYLTGIPEVIPSPWFVEIVTDIDTTSSKCQLKREEYYELDNRKKILLNCQSRAHFEQMNMSISAVAVVVGNVRYAPFQGIYSNDKGKYRGRTYVRNRTRGDILVVKNMKPHYKNGTWYAQPEIYDRIDLVKHGNPDTKLEDRSSDSGSDDEVIRQDGLCGGIAISAFLPPSKVP